jgi:hypothetical protein
MATPEPPLPVDVISNLVVGRDQIVTAVEAWSIGHRKGETIGHAGHVTGKFLKQQAGQAMRSVITVIEGDQQRIAGGSAMNSTCTFLWFVIVRGLLKDRTTKGLNIVGEALRLVADPPWMVDSEAEDAAESVFSTHPVRMGWKSLYTDDDEKNGMSIWMIQWEQAIELGTASRPRDPGPEPLVFLDGGADIDGEPNPDELEYELGENPEPPEEEEPEDP